MLRLGTEQLVIHLVCLAEGTLLLSLSYILLRGYTIVVTSGSILCLLPATQILDHHKINSLNSSLVLLDRTLKILTAKN